MANEHLLGLGKLVDTFANDVAYAEKVEFSDGEEGLLARIAIVGFCYHASPEDWGPGQFAYVADSMANGYSQDDLELTVLPCPPERLRLFAALGLGYLLGLRQSEMIDEKDFVVGENLLFGYMVQHAKKLRDCVLKNSIANEDL